MKAKDYIIIGGAIALFLLWKNKKNKKVTTSTTNENGSQSGSSSAPSGSASAPTGASQTTTTPTSNEPEQIFGASLPTGMDLPVLTAGTGVPTEVAVQQGGVSTTPTPAIVHAPALEIEESLVLGGIKPIVKPIIKALPVKGEVLDLEPIIVRQEPTKYLADL